MRSSPRFESLVEEAHVKRWRLGLAYCFPGRGRLQPVLSQGAGGILLAGDFLGTRYAEAAIQTGFFVAQDIHNRLAVPASPQHDGTQELKGMT